MLWGYGQGEDGHGKMVVTLVTERGDLVHSVCVCVCVYAIQVLCPCVFLAARERGEQEGSREGGICSERYEPDFMNKVSGT